MATYPPLYGIALKGKAKVWQVSVEDRKGLGVVIVKFGYIDGKQQVNERIVSVGKNLGKKNETTPVQQAISEATSLWNKKKDAGYSETLTEAAPDGEDKHVPPINDDSDAPPLPMLAHDYNKRGKSIKFPCYAQRKLDGVRCVAIADVGLYSRNGKPMSDHLGHIVSELNTFRKGTKLDGELYSDTLTFQEIVGLVKKTKAVAGDAAKFKQIYLCVYDIINSDVYEDRYKTLKTLIKSDEFKYLRLLPTEICKSADDVKGLHAEYVAEGYEGLILRNKEGKYEVGHRSVDLQKYKEFIDEEFEIIGFKEGDGLEKGCVIWRCTTKDGQEFDCRPRGTREEREELYRKGKKYIGKMLTIRFQEWTTDGKPRFPVGLAIRDYE
jgi:DNA ligase-1